MFHYQKTDRLTEICSAHSTNILVLSTISLQTFLNPIHIQCVTSQMRAELCAAFSLKSSLLLVFKQRVPRFTDPRPKLRYRTLLLKLLNTNFHENLFSGSRVVSCDGRTDRQTDKAKIKHAFFKHFVPKHTRDRNGVATKLRSFQNILSIRSEKYAGSFLRCERQVRRKYRNKAQSKQTHVPLHIHNGKHSNLTYGNL